MPKKRKSGFYRFVIASLDGKSSGLYHRGLLLAALVALSIWLALSAIGMQDVFMRMTQLKQLSDAWSQGQALKTQLDSQGGFSLGWNQEKGMPPWLRSLIVNTGTVAAIIIFLSLMAWGRKDNWAAASVTAGVSSIPLSIGMVVAYGLFKLANNIENNDVASTLTLLAIALLLQALMTGLIMLYVNIQATLSLTERRRYWTCTLAVFVGLAVFSMLTRLLA